MSLLTVRNLGKTYPSGVQALKDISFKVNEGEFLVVIGLSGSGKSTLLRCLNRLIMPTTGEIELLGKKVEQLSEKGARELRRDVAMIFQHFNIVPRSSVRTNVLAGRLAHTSVLNTLLHRFSPVGAAA